MSAPADTTPTGDAGLVVGQVERLARGLTERLFVDTVTPATEETDLAHVYGEDGTQYVVDVRHGSCTCDDYTYRHEGGEWRCKHGHRARVVVNGAAALPKWADVDALDEMLQRRLERGGGL